MNLTDFDLLPLDIRKRYRGIEARCAAKYACGKWFVRFGGRQSTMFVRFDGRWVARCSFFSV